jgi:hypothetical protein
MQCHVKAVKIGRKASRMKVDAGVKARIRMISIAGRYPAGSIYETLVKVLALIIALPCHMLDMTISRMAKSHRLFLKGNIVLN